MAKVPVFATLAVSSVAAVSAVAGLTAKPAYGQQPFIEVSAAVEPEALGPGDRGRMKVDIEIPSGWHLWSLDPGRGPKALRIDAGEGSLAFEGEWHGDAPRRGTFKGFSDPLGYYEGETVHLYRHVRLRADAPLGPQTAELRVRAQICTDAQCLDDEVRVPVQFEALQSAAGADGGLLPGEALTVGTASRPDDWVANAKAQGLFVFVFWAFIAGLGALATPCVFPAIPLTLSFFSKYSEQSFLRNARLAGTYALTMVASFTLVGVIFSLLFGAVEVKRFSEHPIFNLLLGGMLVFFGLNLLGLFEIQVPQGVLRFVNKLENRFGAGARLTGAAKSGVGDYLVVSIAAITATTVFFTCTVAFVGNIIVAASKGEWFWATVGMLAFGLAFAAPFFLLALFPQAAFKLARRSGGWLGATQVVLGFLELAAAAKFISNADLVLKWGVVTREAVLALWIPLFALCGLYLLGKLTIGDKSLSKSDGSVPVLQMLASTAMFGLALYLAAGMFSGRTFPSWISAWLPPSTYPNASSVYTVAGFKWFDSLEQGRRDAEANGRLVFVNYTGYTCTNCRFMEESIFPVPAVAEHLSTMSLVELFTDDGSPSNERARRDQARRFKTVALPLYSVERPDGEIIATYPGSTNSAVEFGAFLAEAKARAGEIRPSDSARNVSVAGRSPAAIRLDTTDLFEDLKKPAIHSGKWTLVNFWASYCGPCKEELQEYMVDIGRKLEVEGAGFAVVALDEDEDLDEARAFARQIALPRSAAFRLPADPRPDQVDPKFGYRGSLPFTALVSPAGEIVWRHEQKVSEAALRAELNKHLDGASL